MEAYPKAAMERTMKVQYVMLQAMAKKITWWRRRRSWASATGTCGAGGSAAVAEFNPRFQVAPRQGQRVCACRSRDLERVFSLQFERSVNRNNTVSFQNLSLQIERVRWRATLAGCHVVVHPHLNGTLSLTHGPHCLAAMTRSARPNHV